MTDKTVAEIIRESRLWHERVLYHARTFAEREGFDWYSSHSEEHRKRQFEYINKAITHVHREDAGKV